MNIPIVIDADAHVEEGVETWDYLDPEFRDRRPIPVLFEGEQYDPIYGNVNGFWLIDGKPTNKPIGAGAMVSLTPAGCRAGLAKPYTIGSQQLTDVAARLRDMDNFGAQVQVVYPTIFNRPLSDDDRFLSALHRSYNDWVAVRCGEAPERLKWGAIMPMHDPDAAVDELRRTHDKGAVSALLYPMARSKSLADPVLDRFYAEAERLDMPLVVHIGWYFDPLTDYCTNLYTAQITSVGFPLLIAFVDILGSDLLERFPGLRIAFMEAGAGWLPNLVERMDHYYAVNEKQGWWRPARRASEWIKSGRIYVSFEPEERLLPQVIDLMGDETLLMSSDIPHAEDRETTLMALTERADVGDAAKQKICFDNPNRFYGLGL